MRARLDVVAEEAGCRPFAWAVACLLFSVCLEKGSKWTPLQHRYLDNPKWTPIPSTQNGPPKKYTSMSR